MSPPRCKGRILNVSTLLCVRLTRFLHDGAASLVCRPRSSYLQRRACLIPSSGTSRRHRNRTPVLIPRIFSCLFGAPSYLRDADPQQLPITDSVGIFLIRESVLGSTEAQLASRAQQIGFWARVNGALLDGPLSSEVSFPAQPDYLVAYPY